MEHRWVDQSVEMELAKELNQMSMVSRNAIFEEIHCLGNPPVETEDMISSKIADLEKELSMLPRKTSYEKAMALSSHYASSVEFKLRFLRSELYDAKLAAIRLEKYLSYLEEHFGVQALKRPIYMNDLDKQEQDIIKTGNFQLLPCRDRSGRRIAVRMGMIGGQDIRRVVRFGCAHFQMLVFVHCTLTYKSLCLVASADASPPLHGAGPQRGR